MERRVVIGTVELAVSRNGPCRCSLKLDFVNKRVVTYQFDDE